MIIKDPKLRVAKLVFFLRFLDYLSLCDDALSLQEESHNFVDCINNHLISLILNSAEEVLAFWQFESHIGLPWSFGKLSVSRLGLHPG